MVRMTAASVLIALYILGTVLLSVRLGAAHSRDYIFTGSLPDDRAPLPPPVDHLEQGRHHRGPRRRHYLRRPRTTPPAQNLKPRKCLDTKSSSATATRTGGLLTNYRSTSSPTCRRAAIRAWSDKHVEPGSKWLDEIEATVAKTSVVVMLVSKDFLASDFIREHEFWPSLEKTQRTAASRSCGS